MKKLSMVISIAILLFATAARAKVLEVFVQPQAGGLFGLMTFEKLPWGNDSRELNQDEDYFITHRGPNAGVSAGLEFAFVDVVLDINQFYRHERKSTLFNVMVGLDADFNTSPDSVWTVYLFGGYGMGTIDNAWLEKEKPQIEKNDLFAQIFFLRAGFRYEYKLTEMIRLALDAGVGAHLLTIAYKAVNEDNAQSAGVHAYAMGGVRFYWDFFGKKERAGEKDTVSLPPDPKPAPATEPSVAPASAPAPSAAAPSPSAQPSTATPSPASSK